MRISRLGMMKSPSGGGGGGGGYWINLLGGTIYEVGLGVAVDSSNNIVVTGYTTSVGEGVNELLVAKYDSSGSLLWARTLGGTVNDTGYGVAIDSVGNIIISGVTSSDGAGGNDLLVAKYDSSGSLLWARTLGGTSSEYGYSVAVDSSDNIVVVGQAGSDGAGDNDILVAKYNSSGTLQWDKTLGGTNPDIARAVAVDSFDNIIVFGYTSSDGAGGNDLLVAKYNSSGTFQWARILGGANSGDFGFSGAVDSLDNIILVGTTDSDGAGSRDCLVAKYNSSGTLQWSRTLGGTGLEVNCTGTVDSLDNIILCGSTQSDGAGGYDILVAKYNSSGTFQWSNTLGGTASDLGYAVAVDSLDNIIIGCGTSSDGAGSNDLLVAKLPPDGSRTGTYGGLVYQAAVLTDDVAVLTENAAVLTDDVAVLTDDVAVLTDAAATLTEEFFALT